MPHTPGPWTIQPSDNGVDTIHDAEGRHFANFRSLRGVESIAAADRQLVGSAPAMLDALRDALDEINAWRRKFHPGDSPDPAIVHTATRDKIAAAIAAAEVEGQP